MKWPITSPAYFRPVCAVLKATISFQKKMWWKWCFLMNIYLHFHSVLWLLLLLLLLLLLSCWVIFLMISLRIVRSMRASLQKETSTRWTWSAKRARRWKACLTFHVWFVLAWKAQKIVEFLQATSIATLFLGLPRRLYRLWFLYDLLTA